MRTAFDHRGMPTYGSAFSPDGTIVALAHGPVISLWDTESNALLRTVDGGGVSDTKRLVFVGAEGRYLAAIGSKGLVVWDLLSCEGTFPVSLGTT
jgi:NET1-associated nuclear protein 1 (U3 small nucleolar RNA-associated protein 17)